MSAYLKRSKVAPLRLHLIVDNTFIKWSRERLGEWIKEIEPYLKRCTRLSISTSQHATAKAIFPLHVPMSNLREFAWDGGSPLSHDDDEDEDNHTVTFLDPSTVSSPSYRLTYHMGAVSMDWNDQMVSKLVTLKLYDLAGRPTRRILQLIPRCTSLKRLRWVQHLSEDEQHTEALPPFTSTSLEVLDIDLPDNSDEERSFIWNMDFPSLRYLSIATRSLNTRWADRALGSATRFPLLISLWLSAHAFTPPTMITFLHAHPNVEQFGCGINPNIGGLLSLLVEPTFVVPRDFKLSNLKFIYFLSSSHSSSVSALSDSIRSLFRSRAGYASSKENGNERKLFKIQLNDESWTDHLPEDLVKLRQEYAGQVILSNGDDSVPDRFRPV
ncbi:uncharacterized protein EI90DRAFT_3045172 [Cantharellus anzutake]|uniref:uncharacterized protein n=1 Tax=Cantharellus anzutake TaxID=1750568 RepID=UPI001903E4C3|nr:uncharacterized protein EI90DRAFT_3092646 [Cantharellus anzutake]XP_038919102.1 uncharacterized protein EI90DRAFT_3045172 [Cantharellus anzutake]KAF8313018.1 hypothetical protein EI90DRAFT_3092646 [Cantharellus anzutake]KAF8336289.1 hypothetical protein EI90DRAFT_3045172 [Cantharellus anzutake]